MNSLKLWQKIIIGSYGVAGGSWVATGAIIPFLGRSGGVPLGIGAAGRLFWLLVAFVSFQLAFYACRNLIGVRKSSESEEKDEKLLGMEYSAPIQVLLTACSSLIFFTLACWYTSTACFVVSPLISFFCWAYPFRSRGSITANLLLGGIHAFMLLLGWAAVAGTWTLTSLLLAFSVLVVTAGNSIINAVFCNRN